MALFIPLIYLFLTWMVSENDNSFLDGVEPNLHGIYYDLTGRIGCGLRAGFLIFVATGATTWAGVAKPKASPLHLL